MAGLCRHRQGPRRDPPRGAREAKEREELAAIGNKLFDEIVERLRNKIGKKAVKDACKRLGTTRRTT